MRAVYNSIDLTDEGPSDMQIDLDVPRCHQYNDLLSSPEGQQKLTNVLRAWTRYNRDKDYWQGVDSLVAPFVVLHFNEECTAFFCLQRVVDHYLRNFFAQDEPFYLQETLALYQKVFTYTNPELALHLSNEMFTPSLYAIPWFLTLFAHSIFCKQPNM